MIKIELAGAEKLRKELEKKLANTNKRLRAESLNLLLKTQADIRRDAPVNLARLKNGTTVNRTELKITNAVKYAPFVEWGTKSNVKVPSGYESYASQFRGIRGDGTVKMLDAITQWVKRKGLAATYSVKTRKRTARSKSEVKLERSIAFLIMRKIRKFGMKPQPFFFHDKNGNDRIKKLESELKKLK